MTDLLLIFIAALLFFILLALINIDSNLATLLTRRGAEIIRALNAVQKPNRKAGEVGTERRAGY